MYYFQTWANMWCKIYKLRNLYKIAYISYFYISHGLNIFLKLTSHIYTYRHEQKSLLPHSADCQTRPEVIKLEYSLRLKIKHNDWLLADTCLQAANHCALFWVMCLLASSQSLCFILSLRMNSSFITWRPGRNACQDADANILRRYACR